MILRSPPNDEERGIGSARLESSFPRKRESRLVPLRATWIPAPAFARACFRIAGMTDPWSVGEMEPHILKRAH